MPRYVVGKVAEALNQDGKAVKGSRVLVLGLAYKANVDDDRESPSYEIIGLLQRAGASVDYCDPHFPVAKKTRKHDLGLRSVAVDADTFSRYDAVVVATAHDAFKDERLYENTRLVVDTRNIVSAAGSRRVVKA